MTTKLQFPTTAQPPEFRLAVSVNEACRALNIGRTSLYELLAEKKLCSARVAGRRVIPVSELQRLLADSIEQVPAVATIGKTMPAAIA